MGYRAITVTREQLLEDISNCTIIFDSAIFLDYDSFSINLADDGFLHIEAIGSNENHYIGRIQDSLHGKIDRLKRDIITTWQKARDSITDES